MNIPKFWHYQTHTFQYQRKASDIKEKSVTLGRWGWSNESQDLAMEHAKRRCADAEHLRKTGQPVHYRESKNDYWDSNGIPIREEILSNVESNHRIIITRNSYGAHCINAADIGIVDIDFKKPHPPFWLHACIALAVFATMAWMHSLDLLFGMSSATLLIIWIFALIPLTNGTWRFFRPSPQSLALKKLEIFFNQNPSWGGRVYRTCAGLRVILTHDRLLPTQDVLDKFKDMGADPLYVELCRKQQCFRARVTAKPWRMQLQIPRMPKDDHAKAQWIPVYEQQQKQYRAAAFLEHMGNPIMLPSLDQPIGLHDVLSQVARETAMA
jgi:hypothetical protein